MRNGGTRVFGRADYIEKFRQVKIKRKIKVTDRFSRYLSFIIAGLM